MTYAPTVLGAPAYGMGGVMASPYGGFAPYGGARRIVAQPRYTLGAYAAKGYEARHVTDEKLNNLKAIAQDGKLTRDMFDKAYIDLLSAHGVSAPSADVSAAVYDLFDRDQNGVVDMMELVCAISLLC